MNKDEQIQALIDANASLRIALATSERLVAWYEKRATEVDRRAAEWQVRPAGSCLSTALIHAAYQRASGK